MGFWDFLDGDRNAPSITSVENAKRRILLENRMFAGIPVLDEGDERFLADQYWQALINIRRFNSMSRLVHKELHFKLLDASFVSDEEKKAIVEGRCPKCGLTYKYDGKHCSHCGFSDEAIKDDKA